MVGANGLLGTINLVGTESIRDPAFKVETNGAGLKGKRDNCTRGEEGRRVATCGSLSVKPGMASSLRLDA